MEIIIFVTIGVIGLILIAVLKKSSFEDQEKLPYQLKPAFFNKSEEALFFELKKSLTPEYYVFPKTRIIDFIEPTSSEYKWRNKIWAKHVDFLICDQYFKPILVIELNGKSHFLRTRAKSDDFKKHLFEDLNLSFEIVQVGEDFSKRLKLFEVRKI